VTLESAPDPLRRLAALLPPDAPGAVAARLKLSNAERDRLVLLAAPPYQVDLDGDERIQRRVLHRLGTEAYGDLVLLRAAETGQGQVALGLIAAAPSRLPPTLPIRGADVTQLGIAPGPPVGSLLAEVEAWWVAQDFRPDRAACLARLAALAALPTALAVMGVSGSGKSTVATLLAARLGWQFVEGDDLHPPANVEKMRRGIPLDDADRVPWLARVAGVIDGWRAAGTHGVVTCSALKRSYRATIAAGRTDVRFVYLKGDHDLIAGRLARRQGHFMPPALLDSQFATLEEPGAEENSVAVDIGPPPEAIVDSILAAIFSSPLEGEVGNAER
jgi:carbohydrate kinase (thermoresistant glucokinase family)